MTATVPRREPQRRIAEWLAGDARAMVVVGSGGTGKTTLVAQLDAPALAALAPGPWAVAVHWCRLSVSDSRVPAEAIERLAQALAREIDGYAEELAALSPAPVTVRGIAFGEGSQGVVIHSLSLADEDPAATFRRTIALPLRSLGRSGRLRPTLLVIDGLDEAARPGYANLMAELATAMATSETLPSAVRVLVTTRPEDEVLAQLSIAGFRSLDLDAGGPDDVRVLVEGAAASVLADVPRAAGLSLDRLAALIVEQAGANFLLAQGLIEQVRLASTAVSADAVRGLPSTLAEQYCARLVHLLGGAREPALTLLGALSVAQRPLDENEVAHATELAVREARAALARLGPLLSREARDGGPARFWLAHPSLARFLHDRDEAGPWWCDEREQHDQIARALLEQASGGWRRLDDYGLRYAGVHAVAADPARWRDVMRAEWVAEAFERLGPSTTMAVLAELQSLPQLADSPDVALVTGLLGLEVRDQTRYLAERHVPALLIRARGLERTLSDLGTLPEADWHSSGPLVEIAAEMIRQGRLADVEELLAALPAPRRNEIALYTAQEVALQEPDAALRMLSLAGEPGRLRGLCGGLAAHDEHVAAAAALAGGDAGCLTAVAEALGPRDPMRAMRLLSQAEPAWDTDPWGVDKSLVGPAELQLRLAERLGATQPAASLEVFRAAAPDTTYIGRPLIGQVALTARDDPERALELIGDMHPGDHFGAGLALALVAGRGVEAARAARQRWQEVIARADTWRSAAGPAGLAGEWGIVAAGVTPLEDVAGDDAASRLALDALERLVDAIVEQRPRVEVHEDAAGTVGAAIAVLDPQRGAEVAQRLDDAFEGHGSHAFHHPLLPVVERVMPIDPKAAWALCERIEAPWEEPTVVYDDVRERVFMRIADRSLADARAVLNGRLHPRLRARLAGALAIAAPQEDVRAITAHLPALGEVPGAAERRAAVARGLDRFRSNARYDAAVRSLHGHGPMPLAAAPIRDVLAPLSERERAAAIVRLVRRGDLDDARAVLDEVIATASAQLSGPAWSTDWSWRDVLVDAASALAERDLHAAVSAVVRVHSVGVLGETLAAMAAAGTPAPPDAVVEQLVEEAAGEDWQTWSIIAEALVQGLGHPPSPDAPAWQRLPPDVAAVVRAVLLLPADEAKARRDMTAIAGDDRDMTAWLEDTAIGVLSHTHPERAVELAQDRFGARDEPIYATWARTDRDAAWARACAGEPPDWPAMVAILGEVPGGDWRWSAGKLAELPAGHSDALERLVRALPHDATERRHACDTLADWLAGHPDGYSSRLAPVVAQAGDVTPRLAAGVIRAHMRQALAYADEQLDDITLIAAAAGEDGAEIAAGLLARLAEVGAGSHER